MKKPINSIIVDDEKLAREVLENHLSRIESVNLKGSCKNAMEAFDIINSQEVDLIFLDINMPGISGLSLARMIRRDVKVIFTTAYRDYAVDGFDLKAVDYLLKPVSFERLLQSIQKYMDEQPVVMVKESASAVQEKDDYIFVRSNRKMVRVDLSSISFIESLGDYVKIYIHEKKTVVSRESLSNLLAKLPAAGFARVHRSFVVSLAHIESYTNESINLAGREIPLSRYYREAFVNRISS